MPPIVAPTTFRESGYEGGRSHRAHVPSPSENYLATGLLGVASDEDVDRAITA